MAGLRRVLLSTQDAFTQSGTIEALQHECQIDVATTRESVLDLYARHRFEFAFLDIDIVRDLAGRNLSFEECLEAFWETSTDPEIVVLCRPDMVRQAVQVVRAGANSYLTYPVEPSEVRYVVDGIREYNRLRVEVESLREAFWLRDVDHLVKTESEAMKRVIQAARSVSVTDSTVLLTGETGTGKGVLARLIHQHSARRNGPFVSVHCGAIPGNLIESELFGHERGAFTGAVNRKIGKFELAERGTVFLDEVGTMPAASQTRLLKVLQERSFQRVGGEKDIAADVRVIAAANRDLLKMAERGEMRSDLYYRLNVFPIELPPLRERTEDIPHIVTVILKRLNATYGKGIQSIGGGVLKGFQGYSWPGNIRELENVVERAYILESGTALSREHFPPEIALPNDDQGLVVLDTGGTLAEARRKAVEEAEVKYLRDKLTECVGRIDKTAHAAGITPRQLHKLMTRYGLHREDYVRRPAPAQETS